MSSFEILKTIFLLVSGHALGDFALQNEWIATNKNRHARLSLSPEKQKSMQIIWPYLLSAHALIHGMIVFIITGKISLGIAETLVHWMTDFAKCEKWISFHTDQFIHILCKIIWIYLLASGLAF